MARVARELSNLSLECEEGDYLGAEDVLLAKLRVSRPTLRQAAKISEAEHMISVRRGIRGGFYAARPDVDDAIRALNRYLRLRGVTLRELNVISGVSEEAAELAARCDDAILRAQMAAMLAELADCQTPRALMDFDIRFLRLIGTMSGNPVVDLIIAMSYSFGRDEQGIYLYEDDAQKEAAHSNFNAIGRAVLDGDGALARFMMHRRILAIRTWIEGAHASQFGPINHERS